MKALLALIAACATACADGHASPKPPQTSPPPQLIDAELLWQTAEHTTEPQAAAKAWRAAAIAFDKAVAVGGAETAYAAVLAWRSALQAQPAAPSPETDTKSTPLSADETAFVRAVGVYLPMAISTDRPAMQFLRGNLLRKHRHYDAASRDFIEIVTTSPSDETAGFSAQLLLDVLNQQRRYDELASWVDKMRASPSLIVGQAELVALLDRLHMQVLRKRAEEFEQLGRAGDPTAFHKCGDAYRDAFVQHPTDERADEVLYNAATCYNLAHDDDAAQAACRDLVATFPHSKLAAKVQK